MPLRNAGGKTLSERRRAAAIKYTMESYNAPKVVATGMGKVAEKIIEKAEESDVPVVYNKELANLLTNVDIGEEIPSELYEAVATIIAYVADVDALMKK